MASKPIIFSVKSDPQNLGLIREQVAKVAKDAGFDEEWRGRIVLAVDEAVTNIIRHAYGRAADKEIKVTLENDTEALKISLRDFGPKPDVSKIFSRDLKDIRPGGLGCHFIKEIMDEVVYDVDSHEVGTELKLVKLKRQATRDK